MLHEELEFDAGAVGVRTVRYGHSLSENESEWGATSCRRCTRFAEWFPMAGWSSPSGIVPAGGNHSAQGRYRFVSNRPDAGRRRGGGNRQTEAGADDPPTAVDHRRNVGAAAGFAFWGHIRRMLDYPYLLGIGCVLLLGLPLLFGTEIGGSKNWLVFGPISIQPSELGKIVLVFFLAAYLSDHRRVLTLPSHRFLLLRLPPLRFIAPLICIWGMAVLMFVVERDLGSALLFFGMAVLMTYMATGSKSYVFLALVFIGAAAAVSYAMFGHVRVRFDIWLNPWQDPNGMAYQVVQSMFAFGTGGIWGTGFGYGHPGFIPEVHTDFIFAAIAEEMGLVGAMMIIACYVMLFWRGIRVALAVRNEKEMLLAGGCSCLILLQMFIIIAGVTKFLPLTGITLPFVSYGGSSMVAGFLLLGVLLSLSKEQEHG